jgi:hypothetical protein
LSKYKFTKEKRKKEKGKRKISTMKQKKCTGNKEELQLKTPLDPF